MELWMLYSLGNMFFLWIGWFLQKIEVERKLSKNSYIVYAHIWIIVWTLLYAFLINHKFVFDWILVTYAIGLSSIYVIVFRYRLKSLDYITSASYFINYRIFSSILLVLFWQLLYWESITWKEYLWIFIWFIIFYLLIEKKKISDQKKDMWKWYIYLWIWIIWVSIIWLLQKKFILLELDFITYILCAWINGTLLPLLLKEKSETLKNIFFIKENKDKLLLFIAAFIAPFNTFFMLLAIDAWWDIAIVYKIISYSLFIPVILSVIIYKESVTWRKLLAFILTIASIGLFV